MPSVSTHALWSWDRRTGGRNDYYLPLCGRPQRVLYQYPQFMGVRETKYNNDRAEQSSEDKDHLTPKRPGTAQ